VIATANELLYPLTLFCESGGHVLPSFEPIDGAAMPEPYRSLLVHRGDMTSRLEEFHGGAIILEVLHREQTPDVYRREVVLHIEATGLPVEYGAIEISLSEFDGDLRRLILEQHLPLGGLLNRFGVKYRSEPQAFIRLGPDPVMQRVFGTPLAREFHGRCNLLVGEGDRVLAQIVEVLRPVEQEPGRTNG
jgi:chorismate-pyruvate lyase